LNTEAQSDSTEDALVYRETKEKPTNSVLITIAEVTEAITKATEIKNVTVEIQVQETCNVESRILNKEMEQGKTYKDVHSIDYIINFCPLFAKHLHPILSRLLLIEKF